MKRKYLSVAIISLGFASTTTSRAQEMEGNKRPNIIRIMTDDHSIQTISAYRHPIAQMAPTPNIDRLAEEGILFEKAFVENSLSTPSRACLLTGMYSHQNGQRTLGKGIDTTQTFFSELLQEAGYQTAIVGKWHLQCSPKGFDEYVILDDQGEYYNPRFKSPRSNKQYIREEGYATNLITNHAVQFLENRDAQKPFCLLIHHKAPHRNWQPEEKYLNLYEESEFPKPTNFYDDYNNRCSAAHTQRMSIDQTMSLVYDLKLNELKDTYPFSAEPTTSMLEAALNRMTDSQRANWEEAYHNKNRLFIDAMKGMTNDEIVDWKYQRYLKDYLRCIKSIDDEVGRLIEYLERENLLDNTIIVYTSDQGFYMGEHGWFDKRFMYEESFRTPLIVRYPERIKAGIKTDALVQNIDFAPTYLALAGIAKPNQMSGMSIEPLFGGETPSEWRTDLYYHFYDYPAEHNVRRHDGVRTDRYKLIHFYGKGEMENDEDIECNELYDLANDPNEMNNLYGKSDYEAIALDLQKRLDEYRFRLRVDEY